MAALGPHQSHERCAFKRVPLAVQPVLPPTWIPLAMAMAASSKLHPDGAAGWLPLPATGFTVGSASLLVARGDACMLLAVALPLQLPGGLLPITASPLLGVQPLVVSASMESL